MESKTSIFAVPFSSRLKPSKLEPISRGWALADIFISYARDDRDRVGVIADGLKAEGFSVWWDPNILPGATYDDVIEEELDRAKCAIVAWSPNSRTSKFVRAEAGEASDRDVLIPVILEDVKIPLAFRRIQAEPMMDWQGDRQAESWQRIILKADALVGERGGQTETEAEKVTARSPHTGEKAKSRASSTYIITAIAGAGLFAMWMFGDPKNFGVLGVTFALAAMAFILFRFAEADLSPHMKAMATRWLLPVKGKVEVNSAEAFLNMFEAVFGPKHLSWRCIWRSALASMLGYTLMLVIFLIARGQYDYFDHAIFLFAAGFLGVILNIVGDYFSLWETRVLLRIGARRPGLLPILIVLDALLTFAIFSAGIFSVSVIMYGLNVSDFEKILAQTMMLIEVTSQGWLDISPKTTDLFKRETLLFASVFGASLATAYITSLWLWLSVIFGPIARALVWSRTTGATFLGKLFDVEHRPFTALGYLTAFFVILSGSLIWGVTLALAAMG